MPLSAYGSFQSFAAASFTHTHTRARAQRTHLHSFPLPLSFIFCLTSMNYPALFVAFYSTVIEIRCSTFTAPFSCSAPFSHSFVSSQFLVPRTPSTHLSHLPPILPLQVICASLSHRVMCPFLHRTDMKIAVWYLHQHLHFLCLLFTSGYLLFESQVSQHTPCMYVIVFSHLHHRPTYLLPFAQRANCRVFCAPLCSLRHPHFAVAYKSSSAAAPPFPSL
jgi:hypothetical protein